MNWFVWRRPRRENEWPEFGRKYKNKRQAHTALGRLREVWPEHQFVALPQGMLPRTDMVLREIDLN
jgi:hypothetical protein